MYAWRWPRKGVETCSAANNNKCWHSDVYLDYFWIYCCVDCPESYIFSRRFCKIASGFGSLDFVIIIFFYRARSSALHPSSNLEDQISVFTSPSDRVVQLYRQAPGFLFVAFYDSQDYNGGILTHLHRGVLLLLSFYYVHEDVRIDLFNHRFYYIISSCKKSEKHFIANYYLVVLNL
jgi:hypothetical protein